MFAIEFSPPTIPDWVNRIALPKYPSMPLAGYVLLTIGVLVLLIGYFTPIKKLPSLLAGGTLLAYYPLSYIAHWLLFRFDERERALREPNKFEDFFFHRTWVLDWSILGVCAFFGLVFLVWTIWATLRKRRRLSPKESVRVDKTVSPSPPVQPRVATTPATAPRPPAAAPRKVPKRPPAPPSSDNPFNFG